MNRQTLPTRRPSINAVVHWNNRDVHFTVSLHPRSGLPMEVFADLPKDGDLAYALRDAAILVSVARQYGVPDDVMRKSLVRTVVNGVKDGVYGPYEVFASLVGVVVDVLLSLPIVAADDPNLISVPKTAAPGGEA